MTKEEQFTKFLEHLDEILSQQGGDSVNDSARSTK